MNQNSTKRLALTGIVAAVYAVLTLVTAYISYGPIQFRLSEVMVLLALIDPIYIVSLTIGCFIANLFSPNGLMDIIFGTLATFLSCVAIYNTNKLIINKKLSIWVASFWPTIFNSIIIAWVLNVVANLPMVVTMAQVALGEFVVVTVIGVPVFNSLMKKYGNFFKMNNLNKA